jgi:hypothetical protein
MSPRTEHSSLKKKLDLPRNEMTVTGSRLFFAAAASFFKSFTYGMDAQSRLSFSKFGVLVVQVNATP